MAEPENPQQLAPGAEVEGVPIDTPYKGWQPGDHVGYSLNGSLQEGIGESRV